MYTITEFFIGITCTLLLAAGFLVSGLGLKDKVRNFFILDYTYFDIGYGVTLLVVILMNSIGIHFINKFRSNSLTGEELNIEIDTKIDINLIVGSVMFGIG